MAASPRWLEDVGNERVGQNQVWGSPQATISFPTSFPAGEYLVWQHAAHLSSWILPGLISPLCTSWGTIRPAGWGHGKGRAEGTLSIGTPDFQLLLGFIL